jgi:hypothetical protein
MLTAVGEILESSQDQMGSPKSLVGEEAVEAIEEAARVAWAVGSPDLAGTVATALAPAPTPALALGLGLGVGLGPGLG